MTIIEEKEGGWKYYSQQADINAELFNLWYNRHTNETVVSAFKSNNTMFCIPGEIKEEKASELFAEQFLVLDNVDIQDRGLVFDFDSVLKILSKRFGMTEKELVDTGKVMEIECETDNPNSNSWQAYRYRDERGICPKHTGIGYEFLNEDKKYELIIYDNISYA